MREFERNGLNLTVTKREEVQRLRAQMDELSLQYIKNLNEKSTFLLFSEAELAGLPPEFFKVLIRLFFPHLFSTIPDMLFFYLVMELMNRLLSLCLIQNIF